MTYLLQRSADVMSMALGVIIGGAVLHFAGYGVSQLPLADAWVSPVIRVDDITDIYRDEGKACFSLHLTKLREADPIKYEWHAETPLSPRIGVAVWLATDANARASVQRIEKHLAGETWVRRYCFEMPGTLGVSDTLTMTGDAFHRRNPFWLTQTRLPDFTIGPVRASP